MIKLFTRTTALIWAAVVIAVCVAGRMNDYYHTAPRRLAPTEVVEIQSGLNLDQVARHLSAEGVIRRPGLFRLAVRIAGQARRIRAGEYYLSAAMSPAEVVRVLTSGPPALHKVTIPEGSTLAKVAGVLDRARLVKAADFVAAAKDRELLEAMGLESPTAEGFLFPDTYHLPRGLTAEAIIRVMVERFREVFGRLKRNREQSTRLSDFQTVILASLVETEIIDRDEGPTVASVYTNRLNKNMRLQCDPTVIYGLKDFKPPLTRRHLKIKHPYNTYIHYGLPPGPIANPGRTALESALAPATTDYLYFVARGDGTHQFSRTYDQHLAAVRKFRRK